MIALVAVVVVVLRVRDVVVLVTSSWSGTARVGRTEGEREGGRDATVSG